MILDIVKFRELFPVYADPVMYPDDLLNQWYEIGKCYIAENACGVSEDCNEYMLMLILAHLLYIQDQISTGNDSVVVTSASEGNVSVSLSEPPALDSWSYWLSTSPYGKQLLAMLGALSASGFYVGGSSERRGFRKISGGF